MRHRISAFLVVLCLALVGASASAMAKPAVVVLGIEVIDDGSGIDSKTTELAKILTDALRQRTQLASSPFELAPNSEKDLLEMKLLSGCADEGRACMANIGRELNADRLIYGKVERRDGGYQVSLKLLNVETRAMERSTSDVIPAGDNNPPAINNKWSRLLYNRLTGIPEEGNLTVQANAGQGAVYIDGEMATGLKGGRAQISGLAEGEHTVAVEAKGYRRYEAEVTITAGQTVGLEVELEPESSAGGVVGLGGGSKVGKAERPGGTARILFWTTVVTTVAGAGAVTVTGLQVRGLEDDKVAAINAYHGTNEGKAMPLDQDDACASASPMGESAEVYDICEDGKSKASRANLFLAATGASAIAAGVFYYLGYIKPSATERRTARAGQGDSDEAVVHIAPTITPDYLGAGVRIEF